MCFYGFSSDVMLCTAFAETYSFQLVRSILECKESGKDFASQHLITEHNLLEEDIIAHEDHIQEINYLAVSLNESMQFCTSDIVEKQKSTTIFYNHMKTLAGLKREELHEENMLLKDIDNEESWIKQKKLNVSSVSVFQSCISSCQIMFTIQKMFKRHIEFEKEFKDKELDIKSLQDKGQKMINNFNHIVPKVEWQLKSLDTACQEYKMILTDHSKKFKELFQYKDLLEKIEKEELWINNQKLLINKDYEHKLEVVKGLLKKYTIFEVDFEVHRERCADIFTEGEKLIFYSNYQSDSIKDRLKHLQHLLKMLDTSASSRKRQLHDNSSFLKFMWRVDIVESWIEKLVSCVMLEADRNSTVVIKQIKRHEMSIEEINLEGAYCIQIKQDLLNSDWVVKSRNLLDCYFNHRFHDEYRKIYSVIHHMMYNFNLEPTCYSLFEADEALERHLDLESQVKAHGETFDLFEKFGKQLIQSKHYARIEVEDKVENIKCARQILQRSIEGQRLKLDQVLLQSYDDFAHCSVRKQAKKKFDLDKDQDVHLWKDCKIEVLQEKRGIEGCATISKKIKNVSRRLYRKKETLEIADEDDSSTNPCQLDSITEEQIKKPENRKSLLELALHVAEGLANPNWTMCPAELEKKDSAARLKLVTLLKDVIKLEN